MLFTMVIRKIPGFTQHAASITSSELKPANWDPEGIGVSCVSNSVFIAEFRRLYRLTVRFADDTGGLSV